LLNLPKLRAALLLRSAVLAGVLVALLALPASPARAVTAGADWSSYLFDLGHTGFSSTEQAITPQNASTLIPTSHIQLTDRSVISTQPLIYNNTIYFGSWDGYERAVTPAGRQLWYRPLGTTAASGCNPPSAGVTATGAIASESIRGVNTPVLYAPGGNATLYALNPSTGTTIWQNHLGPSPSTFLWGSPIVYGGSVYIGIASFGDCPLVVGRLVQLNAVTGAVQHTFTTLPSGCIGATVWGTPTLDTATQTIYFATGDDDGKCTAAEPYKTALVAVRASDLSYVGSWQVPEDQQREDGDFGTTPTLFSRVVNGKSQSLVGLVNKNGVFYAFDRSDISSGPVWTSQIGTSGDCPQCGAGPIAPAAWDGTYLYVASPQAAINGTTCTGSIQALDPATGQPVWVSCLQGGVLGAVTAVPGLVEVGAGHTFQVLAAADGRSLFSYTPTGGGVIYGAGAIAHGVLYHASGSGAIWMFAVRPPSTSGGRNP
jgi:outer membrane protein assembly factor BamB